MVCVQIGCMLYETRQACITVVIHSNRISRTGCRATLRLTVMGIPSSAFLPGTKIATLALISAAEINVRVGNPGAAATELKTALLPHISGCSATGKPDSNDWVRTCAAQGQLYPQVQNLIQELQALQGS